MRIAFVIPWYGKDIGGGAEAECRELARSIVVVRPDVSVEVLTTTLREFAADWNENVHAEGSSDDEGVLVRRFAATREKRDRFHVINGAKLMPPDTSSLWRDGRPRSPLWWWEESLFTSKMIHSPNLYRYLSANRDRYDAFLFTPYMFGTTLRGSRIVGDKAVIIPCLHDERAAYLKSYRRMMHRAGAALFWVEAEQRLSHRLYGTYPARQAVIGGLVDTDQAEGNANRFREKFGISEDFVLYAGRKIVGKNVPYLVECWEALRRSSPLARDIRLVLLGRGDLHYPADRHPGVIDLGFVSAQDKRDAYRAATVLCQPSLNESFSIVMMEAWLQGTPSLVAAQCEVTSEHCARSGGGLTFGDRDEFAAAVETLVRDPDRRRTMGERGRSYVREHFDRATVVDRVVRFLETSRHRSTS